MLKVKFTSTFKRDYKRVLKQGLNRKVLEEVVEMLMKGEVLPEKYRDHALVNSRNYKNVRECHLSPDWLLIYRIEEEISILRLIRTSSHSDLFG